MLTKSEMKATADRAAFQKALNDLADAATLVSELWDTGDWNADEDPLAFGHYPSFFPSFEDVAYAIELWSDPSTRNDPDLQDKS